MEFATCSCPTPQCAHHGQRGCGAPLVRRGAGRGLPRLLCTMCQGTFSARQGTAYCGVRAEEPKYTSTMRALAEGNSISRASPSRGSGSPNHGDRDDGPRVDHGGTAELSRAL